MIKSPDGVTLGYGKACIVSLLQLVIAALVLGALALMLIGADSISK
jgi:hypothetical protein